MDRNQSLVVQGRNNNVSRVPDIQSFLTPPQDPGGRRVNVSDRLLICSSVSRNEVVVGGSDHALYSIDVEDSRKKPITMYGKKSGHTDWVTTVAHLPNGSVLSGSMDGRLCMWSSSRRDCTELITESSHPISKVVADTQNNHAFSCCYDGNITLWSCQDSNAGPRAFSSRTGAVPAATSTVFYGHANPVLECAFRGNTLVSGDKGGSLMFWDIHRAEALHRFRGHPGAVTALEVLPDGNTFISCGTDGYVKIWDPRSSSGLVHKIPSHIKNIETTSTGRGNSNTNVRTIGGTVYGGGLPPQNVSGGVVSRSNASAGPRAIAGGRGGSGAAAAASSSGTVTATSAISCLATVSSRGAGGDVSYIITGSGGGGDRASGNDSTSLVVVDVRASCQIVSEWNHHRNGIYSLCVVGEECIYSGDGEGHLLCHHLLSSNLHSHRDCLRFGLGASEKGAVRSISCVNNKVVAACEDGCVMIYEH